MMQGQDHAHHGSLRERVDKLIQQNFVVRWYLWSSLCRDFAEYSVVLIDPLVEFLWGDRLFLCSRYLNFGRPDSDVPLFTGRL